MSYELVLPNEVLVTGKEIKRIFDEKEVFVVGYGSLLFEHGWRRRNMELPPQAGDLKECKVLGWKRGPFGMTQGVHFYGVVPSEKDLFNAVITRIYSAEDWLGLMRTEMIKGLFDWEYNYRVVDVTDCVRGANLGKNAAVHMVANEPENEATWMYNWPAGQYYPYVWHGVSKERSPMFQKEFLATGGYNYSGAEKLYTASEDAMMMER